MKFEEFVQFIATEIQNYFTQTIVILNKCYNRVEVKSRCIPDWNFVISENELTFQYKMFNDLAKDSKKYIQELIVPNLCRDVKYAWIKLIV